jgi:hypothetical protein
MSSGAYLWKVFREQAEPHSGIGQKCSASARNGVRLAPESPISLLDYELRARRVTDPIDAEG